MTDLPKFERHPVHKGVWVRHLTREQAAAERKREEDEEEAAIVKASRRWLKSLPGLEPKEIVRIAERTWFGFGGEVDAIIWSKDGTVEFSGRRYAVRWLNLQVRYPEAMRNESIDVTIYRDPRKPKQLRLIHGHVQLKIQGELYA